LKDAQPAAEGAAPHLIDQVEKSVSLLYQDLRKSLENNFHKTLNQMAWPKKELNLSDTLLNAWTEQVETLLDLQESDLRLEGPFSNSQERNSILLLPLEIMVQPLALRFQYHFFGEKPTNRVDKPEYFLSHVLDLIDQHSDFMTDFLQPVLDKRARFYDLENIYTDAVSSFITALVPMVTTKSLSLLPQISSQPQLLSHFIHELMSFDNTLRDSWAYTPVPHLAFDWKGITWSILSTHDYFNTWLEGEKRFALDRYKDIRDAADSAEFDFDSTGPGSTKPTKGAIRVNDLLETITDRYRELSSFSQKLRFLIDVQLDIFDNYHGHLNDSFQAYLVSTHTAGRLMQGQTKPEPGIFGLKGLESLCKIFGSAEYLERKMSDWSEDIFFLELWDELQDRAKRNSRLTGTIGRDMGINEIAAKTSAAIHVDSSGNMAEGDGGALFDETATSYRNLRERSEAEIVRLLDVNARNNLKPYSKMSNWASLSSPVTDQASLSQSATLDSMVQTLSSLLTFLSTVLATAPLCRVTRKVCQTIQKDLFDNLLMKNSFSLSGFVQLRRDLTAIQSVIDSSIKVSGEAQRSMRKLEEAMVLLGLPMRSSKNQSKTEEGDEGGDEGWGFDEPDANDDDQVVSELSHDSDEAKIWVWEEVEARIFRNNESARHVLAEMGLRSLSEGEARDIIKQRVDTER
jgi:RAD50-interacting protein 1